MDMVCLVVEHHQLVHVSNDHPEVYLGVGGRSGRTLPKKVVHRVVVIGRGGNVVAGIDPVDVGQENIASGSGYAHLVLDVQSQLKIIVPVATRGTVVWQHRVLEESPQALKIF